MIRTRRRRTVRTCALFAAAITAASCFPRALYAREAHLVAGTTSAWVEIQGATGPILAPDSGFSYPYLPYGFSYSGGTLDGIATDGTNAYFLVTTPNFSTRTTSDAIWTYDLATGTRTATTPLQRPAGDPGASDIALLNGTLYIASGPTSPTANGTTRVYSVGPAGALTSVYSRTDSTAATPQIAANSQSNRVVVVPVGGPNYSPVASAPRVLIDASDWSVAQTVTGTSVGQISFNHDGSQLSVYSSSNSVGFSDAYAVPSFTRVSPAPASFGQAGPAVGSAISDAFDYAYPASAPAVVKLYEGTQPFLPLFRTGRHTWQGSTGIGNFASPDATTVDQVTVTSLTWTQSAGPAVQASTTPSPAGPLASNLTIAATTFAVDATDAARGVYSLHGTAALEGHYTATGTDATRPLTVVNTNLFTDFAIDPVSSNLVGNGDCELGPYGWTGFGPYHDATTNSSALLLFPSGSDAHSSQALELGTPESPMMLSFDYDVAKSDPGTADLTVTLAGIRVAFIPGITESSGVRHFSIYLADPRLQGLSNPVLDFQNADEDNHYARLYVDNISLVAVPEPTAAAICALATIPAFLRRRRSRTILQ